jgi:hypothetical protein
MKHIMKRYLSSKYLHCGILLIILLTYSFSIVHPTYATQMVSANEHASNPALYNPWFYFRKYATQMVNESEYSMRNNSIEQQDANRSLISHDPPVSDEKLDQINLLQTPEAVAEQLKNLRPAEIADHDWYKLPSDTIIATLNLLVGPELQEVLANTKPENLRIIFSKIPEFSHELYLNQLDPSTKSYVLNSIQTGSRS